MSKKYLLEGDGCNNMESSGTWASSDMSKISLIKMHLLGTPE